MDFDSVLVVGRFTSFIPYMLFSNVHSSSFFVVCLRARTRVR